MLQRFLILKIKKISVQSTVQQTLKSTAKVGRPRSKSAQKPKVKSSAKKNTNPAKRTVRPILQLEWEVVEINQKTLWRLITRSSSLRFRTR